MVGLTKEVVRMSRLALIGVLAFAGCQSAPPTVWSLPEAKSEFDFRHDDNECALLAKGARANYQHSNLGRALILGAIEDAEADNDYKSCMKARRYVEVLHPRRGSNNVGKPTKGSTGICWIWEAC
jgi:hypothetical protein